MPGIRSPDCTWMSPIALAELLLGLNSVNGVRNCALM